LDLLPAVRRGELGADCLTAFQAIERRFVWQARAAIIIVGATGLYMIVQADLWDRFRSADYWWMHAMVGLWALFAIGLFVLQPLFLDRRLLRSIGKVSNPGPKRLWASRSSVSFARRISPKAV
jgi:uncharacterized membrane protein